MEEWLDHYAKKGWYFAALKFVRVKDSKAPETSAVRVSFKTDVPFYPYKMPTDTWPKKHVRPIALYFISIGEARGQYRGDLKAWEAKTNWSGELPRDESTTLATNIGLTANDIPKNATLTAFHNTANEQDYDQDLVFKTSKALLPTWAAPSIVVLGIAGIGYALFIRRKLAAGRP